MGLLNDKLGLSILKPGSPRDSQTKLSREIPEYIVTGIRGRYLSPVD